MDWLKIGLIRQHGNAFIRIPLRILLNKLARILSGPTMLLSMFLFWTPALAKPKTAPKTVPATSEDIYLYRGIGATYICNARNAGIEFPQAVGIASATYAQVLSGRHGGVVASAGKEKLSNEQLFNGAQFQIITAAMEYCSDQIPKDVKANIKEAIKKQKRGKKR